MSSTLKSMEKKLKKNKDKDTSLPRILIAVPANRDMPPETVMSLLPLVEQVGSENIIFVTNGLLSQNRDSIVLTAVQRNYEYIMWIDDDMVIPKDAITKLLSHNKDICSGIYFGRGNYAPVMYNLWYEEDEDVYSFQGIRDYKQDSLIKVGAVGFGCVLTKVDTMKKIWGGIVRDTTGTCFNYIGGLGEDLSFGVRCLHLGVETWVDTSVKCGHVGKQKVTEEVWLAVKDLKK